MEKVSFLSMAAMAFCAVMSIAVPIVLAIVLRKKYRADWLPFVVGYVVMFLFAFVLEKGANFLILSTPAGRSIQSNVFLFGLFGGFMAALFEESGRALAFGTILRKNDRMVNALMYGAGHGGMEFMMILGVTSINNLICAGIINSGQQASVLAQLLPEQAEKLSTAFAVMVTVPPGTFLLGLAERCMALALQLALSCLVFLAVQRRQFRPFIIAFIAHALVDAAAGILSGLQVPELLIECVILVMTGLVWLMARAEIKQAMNQGQR